MAQTRVTLDAILRATLGSTNVYFDPPESFKLKFPCIVYTEAPPIERFADNSPYNRMKKYMLVYITRDADDPMVDKIDDLRYCNLVRSYISDGFRHYAFDLFY